MNFLELRPGTSVEGDEIKSFRSEEKAGSYTYLMAGVHGDEVEAVYCLKNIFEWMQEEDELEGAFVVIPILNIDGYRQATRVNAHGVDLNRNLPSKNWSNEAREAKYNPGSTPLSEPENIYLDKLFQKYPPKKILSFHSWKPMLNYNGDCKEVALFLEQYNKYPVCDDIKGHPTPGSLGEYGPEKYNSPVLTFEFPLLSDERCLKDIWKENEEGLKGLLKSNLI